MGFAQEMKDFIGAAQAGQKFAANNDQEYNQLKADNLRAQTGAINKKLNDTEGDELDLETKRQGLRNSVAQNQLRAMQAKSEAAYQANLQKTQADPNAGAYAPAPMAVPAVGAQPPQAVTQVPAGMPGAPAFSAGGAVGDNDSDESGPDDDDDGDGAAPGPAVGGAPAAPSGGTSATTDISSRARVVAAGLTAAKAGAAYGSTRHAGAAAGSHAAPAVDMDKLRDAVDPDHRMNDSDRNLAAMGHLYQFKMHQGDTDGAARSAFQMLQYYRNASAKYAALSAVAAQKGDLDTATHAAMKAYANIPDGQNFQVVKTPDGQLSYTVTDMSTGKVTSNAVVPPDKFAAAAMGLTHQGGFDQQLMSAINQTPAPTPPAPVEPKPMKISDKNKVNDLINSSYNGGDDATGGPKMPDPKDPKGTVPRYEDDEQVLHKGIASRIYTHPKNDGITPDEAARIPQIIADPTRGSLDAKPTEGGQLVKINGKVSFVPTDDFDEAMARRVGRLKTKEDTDKKTADDAKSSGDTLKGAIDTGKSWLAKAQDWNNRANDKAKTKIADRAARVKAVPASDPAPDNPFIIQKYTWSSN